MPPLGFAQGCPKHHKDLGQTGSGFWSTMLGFGLLEGLGFRGLGVSGLGFRA